MKEFLKRVRNGVSKWMGRGIRSVIVLVLLSVALVVWASAVGVGSWIVDWIREGVGGNKRMFQEGVLGVFLEFLYALFENTAVACPAVGVVVLMKRWIASLGDLWNPVVESVQQSFRFVAAGDGGGDAWRSMRKMALHFAGPFILLGMVEPAGLPEIDRPDPEVQMAMEVRDANFGTAVEASSLTLVQATVHALKKEVKEHSDKEHGVVCGYVGPDRATQDDRRAVAAIHYGFETDNPVSTLSMLVAKGQFWRVDYCVDDAQPELKERPQVRGYTIMVDVSLPDEAESVSGGES